MELAISQESLAARAGITQGTVQNIEQDRTNPHLSTRKRLCEALGVPVEEHVRLFGPLEGA